MKHLKEFASNGFASIEEIYSPGEVKSILAQISQANSDKDTFRKSTELFAIRQFLKEVPETIGNIFNTKLI